MPPISRTVTDTGSGMRSAAAWTSADVPTTDRTDDPSSFHTIGWVTTSRPRVSASKSRCDGPVVAHER